MKCKRVKKQNFDPNSVIEKLENSQKSQNECCDFYNLYKDALLEQKKIIQQFTLYGNQKITRVVQQQPQPRSRNSNPDNIKLGKKSSVQEESEQFFQDLHDKRDRAQSELFCGNEMGCYSQGNKGKKSKMQFQSELVPSNQYDFNNNNCSNSNNGDIEGELAEYQQKIERLEQKENIQKKRIDELQLLLQQSQKQNKQLQNDIEATENQLVAAKMEIGDLKEFCDNQQVTIKELNDAKKEQLDRIINLENDNRGLIERIVIEKQKIVDKMNELNREEEDMKYQKSVLKEDENYFKQRKNDFYNSVKDQGLKMPQTAPTMSVEQSQEVRNGDCKIPTISKRMVRHHQNEIYAIKSTLNGNLVATAGGDRCIKFYDPLNQTSTGKIQSLSATQFFLDLDFSSHMQTLLVGTTDRIVQIYDYQTHRRLKDFHGHGQQVNSVSFLSDKSKFASASEDRTVKFWDIQKTQISKTMQVGSTCRTICSFAGEPHIMTGHDNGGIRMYTLKENSNKAVYEIPNIFDAAVCNLQVTNCGNYVAATSRDGYSVKVIDIRKQEVVHDLSDNNYFNSHEQNKCSFALSEQFVVAGGQGGTVGFWDIRNTKYKQDKMVNNTQHEGTVIAAYYQDSSSALYTGDSKGNLFIWN